MTTIDPKMTTRPPTLRHILSVDFVTTRAASDGHPEGDRIVLQVNAGTFAGSGPSGPVRGSVSHGADWVVKRPDGSLELDVRAELRADDGSIALMTYTGVSVDGTVRTTPRFSAPHGSSLAWMNHLVCVAEGTIRQGGVRYEVWAMA